MGHKFKLFYLISILCLLVGAGIYLLLALANGWNVWGWFISDQAILVYIIIGAYILFVGGYLLLERIKKL